MRRGLLKSLIISILLIAVFYFSVTGPAYLKSEEQRSPDFRVNQKSIEIKKDGKWQEFKIKGINMGTGYPALFPNEPGIPKKTYYNWLEKIGKMNANVLRVYKTQTPEFYSAFYEYNKNHSEKLYLIQTVDFPESMMYSQKNVLDKKEGSELLKETRELVMAIHGDAVIWDRKNDSLLIYNHDVSQYVLGYALGVEWDEVYVEYINRENHDVKNFNGEYFYCGEGASAFECFLASWADYLVKLESKAYGEQKLISFCNWPDTDPLKNEFRLSNSDINMQKYLESFVDAENIRTKENLKTGVFVSYNVYPYFPSFLQHSDYCNYVDETGKNNPYRKYLMELNAHHKYPVVVSEYGIPASRNAAYLEKWNGFSHGGLTEKEQGEALEKLYYDINMSGCAGSIAFTWQDEWYKTAWNEKHISNPDKRAIWSNAMSAEQAFGILAFEPNDEGKTVYPDGDFSDWNKSDIIQKNADITLSMKYDERYVYILAEGLDKRSGKSLLNIAFDICPKKGQIKDINKNFERPVDFILKLDTDKNAALYVEKQSDIFSLSVLGSYSYTSVNDLKDSNKIENMSDFKMENGSNFSVVLRAQSSILNFIKKSVKADPVGYLKSGNANPKSPDYFSNADFFVKGNKAEIRIPWQLLNFSDPSNCMIIDGVEEGGYKASQRKIRKIYAAAYYDDENNVEDFGSLRLKGWDKPKFHEREKQSYYILQKVFKEVSE